MFVLNYPNPLIVVALFDLFFRWIPYLFVCLPIPGLKGKKG